MVEEHKKDDAKGRVKEAAGSLTGNEDLKQEGQADQAKSDVKEAVDKAGDAVRDGIDKVSGALTGNDKK